jgi:hypothetical protein
MVDISKVAQLNYALATATWDATSVYAAKNQLFWGMNPSNMKCVPEVARRCLQHESAFACSTDPECSYTTSSCFADLCKGSADPCCGRSSNNCNDNGLTGTVGSQHPCFPFAPTARLPSC